ncbi:MAG: S16 family serine protease [Nitrospiraceae bacterium]
MRVVAFVLLISALLLIQAERVRADNTVEVPVLATIRANDRGVFNVIVMTWDKRSAPDPLQLRWGNNRVRVQGVGLGTLGAAFNYALTRLSMKPTGTLSLYGASYVPISSDGPSAGAALAVGFLALLRGDPLIRGIAVTGALELDGHIGHVGGIPDKIRAAAREGYRTVLIPQGQLDQSEWNLSGLGLELNLTVKEVETVEQAYEYMTGQRW